ncbi:MAG: FtsX-like permease family protein [Hyphomicrobiaceae bacterium]
MILTLAMRNLFHDRVRLAVTLVGILFSIVLVAVQLGLYFGASSIITAVIDRSRADLWITAYGAKSLEESGLLVGNERYQALSTPGVAAAVPLIATFNRWQKKNGGAQLCVVIGTDIADGGLTPWGFVEGNAEAIKAPEAVAVDRTYLKNLGITGVGDTGQIDRGRVRVAALTEGIRSFTTTPYVFTTLTRARQLLGIPSGAANYYMVQLKPGADLETVRAELSRRLPDIEVLTKAEFRNRSLDHWLFGTGAGVALIGGALLGTLVGTVIVAQTLYSSTKDHLNEFATLRALGSSSGYIHKVILAQAGLSAVIGYVLGMAIALAVVAASKHSALPMIMTPGLASALFALTVGMCAISAISAIMKVTRIDPAMVFSR